MLIIAIITSLKQFDSYKVCAYIATKSYKKESVGYLGYKRIISKIQGLVINSLRHILQKDIFVLKWFCPFSLACCWDHKMSSRYAFSLTTFSPSGKLGQIEHALTAVSQGITSIGIKGISVIHSQDSKSVLNCS